MGVCSRESLARLPRHMQPWKDPHKLPKSHEQTKMDTFGGAWFTTTHCTAGFVVFPLLGAQEAAQPAAVLHAAAP